MASVSTVVLLLLAPAIGSFLAVLVDRLPRGEDVVSRASRCRACKTRIAPYDLVPLVSFLWLRGRCRRCDAAIPGWLFQMELGALGLAGLAALQASSPWEAWTSALILWLLMALAASDLIRFRLPDALTAALAASVFGATLANGHIVAALWGAALGAGSFMALRLGYKLLRGREGLGLGDIKLMIGLGALSGPLSLPWLVLWAALVALAAAVVGARLGGKDLRGDLALPFGTALCASAAGLWLFGATLV